MFLKNLLYGIIIGIGFIIPGVSGGVLATILGIYDTIIYKLNNLFKDFIQNITYLLPIFIGIFISVFLFSKLILYLLNNNLIFISYVFIGLILGCIPFLIKEINDKTNKKLNIISFLLSLSFGIVLFLIEKNHVNSSININFFTMFIAGILYAIGKLVPGISGAALLMIIGVYEYFLNIVANPFILNLKIILNFIPFIFSFLISAIIILKLLDHLLNKHFQITYSVIIGFVISSILFIYPNYISINSVIITICSFLISYELSKKTS